MNRYDCLERLNTWVDEHMLTVGSLSSNSSIWCTMRDKGANFYSLNMGLCLPFAIGVSLAFPKRKVIALDSDGSLMVDTGTLITLADVNPENLVVLVFDNQAYARMGPTHTSRRADLEKIANGAGIKKTATIRTMDEFTSLVPKALDEPGPSFIVVKVEAETRRVRADHSRHAGRPMREAFVTAVRSHPDYGKAAVRSWGAAFKQAEA